MIVQHNLSLAKGISQAMILIFLAACAPKTDDPASSPETPDAPAATADDASDAGESRAVVAETLAYAEVDKSVIKGHFVFPEDMVDPLPAIILIHEWWGLTDDVRALADRYAGEGYIVLAVDLFGGETAANAADARDLMVEVVENPQFAEDNLRQASDWVLNTTGATQVAAVGYGFGGGWALNAALAMPDDLDAAVMLYGQVTVNRERLQDLQIPLLGLFGGEDSTIPVANVEAFQTTLGELDKNVDIQIFPAGRNGFASPASRNFSEHLETITWRTVQDFLDRHLVVLEGAAD